MNDVIFEIDKRCGEYFWQTKEPHFDNTITMIDFFENHLSERYMMTLHDCSYAEVIDTKTNTIFCLDAKGNGDSFNHCVNWKIILFM